MSIPSKVTLFLDNDNYIKIEGLVDGLDPVSYFNGATVTATLLDSAGLPVTGVTDLPLTYVPASNGNYIGNVQETFAATAGSYTLVIDADQGGIIGSWHIACKVKVRKNE